jgi:hypothetical protein
MLANPEAMQVKGLPPRKINLSGKNGNGRPDNVIVWIKGGSISLACFRLKGYQLTVSTLLGRVPYNGIDG